MVAPWVVVQQVSLHPLYVDDLISAHLPNQHFLICPNIRRLFTCVFTSTQNYDQSGFINAVYSLVTDSLIQGILCFIFVIIPKRHLQRNLFQFKIAIYRVFSLDHLCYHHGNLKGKTHLILWCQFLNEHSPCSLCMVSSSTESQAALLSLQLAPGFHGVPARPGHHLGACHIQPANWPLGANCTAHFTCGFWFMEVTEVIALKRRICYLLPTKRSSHTMHAHRESLGAEGLPDRRIFLRHEKKPCWAPWKSSGQVGSIFWLD